jgi:hypothetical protein
MSGRKRTQPGGKRPEDYRSKLVKKQCQLAVGEWAIQLFRIHKLNKILNEPSIRLLYTITLTRYDYGNRPIPFREIYEIFSTQLIGWSYERFAKLVHTLSDSDSKLLYIQPI